VKFPRTRSLRTTRWVAAATLLLGAGAMISMSAPAMASSAAHPASAVVSHKVTSLSAGAYQAKMSHFWTASRMRAARNADFVASQAEVRAAQAAAAARPSGPAVRMAPAAATRTATGAVLPSAPSILLKPDATGFVSSWTGSTSIPPATTSGKVFFTDHTGGSWVCSASAVNSNGKDMIFTAGHCVFGTALGELPAGETWHSNWIFVPDYNGQTGSVPFGVWGASELFTLTAYANSGNGSDLADDMAVAIASTNSAGQHLVNVVGGQGIEWNFGTSEYIFDFGYPVDHLSGVVLQECDGGMFPGPDVASTVGIPCNFTGGSSGGPWLDQFGGVFGYLDGVNSFGTSDQPGRIFSPYFGNNAGALFNATANL
jgi:hypothetical protein